MFTQEQLRWISNQLWEVADCHASDRDAIEAVARAFDLVADKLRREEIDRDLKSVTEVPGRPSNPNPD